MHVTIGVGLDDV
jgi:hypothetical protein